MSISIIYSRAQDGIQSPLVTIEAHISNGYPKMLIVGLPEKAVKESQDRVRSAIINSNLHYPTRRITINLGPADLPKEGGRFDLPIAIGILAATGQIPDDNLLEYEFAGELALSGQLRPFPGALPLALATQNSNRILILPQHNTNHVSIIPNLNAFTANSLIEVCHHISNTKKLEPIIINNISNPENIKIKHNMRDIKGQYQAKRALEITASGGHNLLLSGPPGTGKTMLASSLPELLPPLTINHAIEVASIHSVRGVNIEPNNFFKRPFRSPHHSASSVAIVGGGSNPKPGEISLAHRGVLFLDELPEFDRHVLEVLREPLESGQIDIARINKNAKYPARFQLIAAMNPCPCGFLGSTTRTCQCSVNQIQRYQNKISGPLLDRIDLKIQVPDLPQSFLLNNTKISESSEVIQQRIIKAQAIQLKRQQCLNSHISETQLKRFCQINPNDKPLMQQAIKKFKLSARSYNKILKVARTIADIHNQVDIRGEHLAEAVGYR